MSETAPSSTQGIVDPPQAGGDDVAAEAVQAMDAAAQTADAIAGEIQNATAGTVPSPGAPGPVAATPAGPAAGAGEPGAGAATAKEAATDVENGPADPAAVPIQTLPVSSEVHRLLAIEVPVIVQLGVRRMTVAEVMRFAVGAILEFSKSAEEDMELLANNMAIGKGQAVKVGENFGIKISSIKPVKEMIKKLGGG